MGKWVDSVEILANLEKEFVHAGSLAWCKKLFLYLKFNGENFFLDKLISYGLLRFFQTSFWVQEFAMQLWISAQYDAETVYHLQRARREHQ